MVDKKKNKKTIIFNNNILRERKYADEPRFSVPRICLATRQAFTILSLHKT